jgi:hypothetical protein
MIVDGIDYEHEAEADAGVFLSTGERWWGSRIKYRRRGIADKRWTKLIACDVHPFDYEKIAQMIEQHVKTSTATR